jgi:hypothetical protein
MSIGESRTPNRAKYAMLVQSTVAPALFGLVVGRGERVHLTPARRR